MSKNVPPRALSSRLLKAVEASRKPLTMAGGDVLITETRPARTIESAARAPFDRGVDAKAAESATFYGDGKAEPMGKARAPRPSPAPAPALKVKTDRKRLIKTSTAADALRRHVTEVIETVDDDRARRLVQIKDIDRLAPTNLSKIIRRQIARSSSPPAMASVDGGYRVDTPADLGRLIRQARDRFGLTQSELAVAAGTGRRFISDLEAGKPTVEFGRALSVCAVLGVNLFAATTS